MYHFLNNKRFFLYNSALAFVLIVAFIIAPLSVNSTHADATTSPESSVAETVIETGDAEAAIENQNIVNTNIVSLTDADTSGDTSENATTTDSEDATITATTTLEEMTATNTPALPSQPPPILQVEGDNSATTSTAADVAAETGTNTANGINVSIDTGDAVAYANILNVVNTNIVDSNGLVTFINDVLGYQDFDVRDTFTNIYTNPVTANSTPSCTLTACNTEGVSLVASSSNTATIENDVTVIASTGNNQATGTTATVTTGNAYATANIVNVANTNIVDSNYLLLVFNNFSDYDGNLVLPSDTFFADQFNTGGTCTNSTLESTNQADVTNTVDVLADSGSNTVQGDLAVIETGDTSAIANIDNTINTNQCGGSSFSMLIRVNGDWNGEIFGLPTGMSWAYTPDGIRLYSTAQGDTDSFGLRTGATVTNINSATIKNNVHVYALTGENSAHAQAGYIQTGEAYANANVTTLTNSNIIGQNWANMIFNIFGNWNGNLSFGVPDLWIGAEAHSSDTPTMPGSKVNYTFTVTNNADTDAPRVILTNSFNPTLLTFTAADTTTRNGNEATASWKLGTIKAGQTQEITVEATTNPTLARNTVTEIPLATKVRSAVADANDSDNAEYISITTGINRSGGKNTGTIFDAKFDITKTANLSTAQPGDTVDYNVTLYDRGGHLYDAILVDILTDSSGTIIQEQSWPLGEISTQETISVDYSVVFSTSTATGTYTNSVQLLGYHGNSRPKDRTLYESPLATHMLTITNEPTGLVLGLATSCEQYLYDFMRYGNQNNHSEVTKLQTFLNTQYGMDVAVTGTFDTKTRTAVTQFQEQYASEVLNPWGLSAGTGVVYLTTQKKINELYCDNARLFPMTIAQQNEIHTYKVGQNNPKPVQAKIPTEIEPLLPTKEVSVVPSQKQTPSVLASSTLHTVVTGERTTQQRDSFIQLLQSRIGSWFATVAEATIK